MTSAPDKVLAVSGRWAGFTATRGQGSMAMEHTNAVVHVTALAWWRTLAAAAAMRQGKFGTGQKGKGNKYQYKAQGSPLNACD